MNRRHLLQAVFAITVLGSGKVSAQMRSWGPANGSLILIGGGAFGPVIRQAMLRLGGTRWVYIPTADDSVERHPLAFVEQTGGSVTRLDTINRDTADSEEFVAPLVTATAVFFGGGRQWRLVDAYAGTRTERALRGVLDRGGLISGNSAGATIQGSYLVRGDPVGTQVLMSPGHERGFGYLWNVAVDQHIRQRHRENDMARVVAAHAGLLGIGIDAGTAAVVIRNTLSVIGPGFVFITDGALHDGRPYSALPAGSRFDLATWTPLPSG
jgi:cyanophycinase